MIICVCHRVSDRDIAREARAGCASFDELQDSLRVGTACGACHECARATFHEHACSGAAPRVHGIRHVPLGTLSLTSAVHPDAAHAARA